MASDARQNVSANGAPAAIIMAAGKGTRMNSDLPKVVHEVAGKPMVWWVVEACRQLEAAPIVVVVGYKGDLVREALAGIGEVAFVEQHEQLGTGHAAQMAAPVFEGRAKQPVFVLAGDGPLIRADTLRTLLDAHVSRGASATLATAVIDDPTGYGRVVRDAAGDFEGIVEHKDADEDQRAIREVNPSYYCFDSDALFDSLNKVSNNNSQGEYYITDVPSLLKGAGARVAVVDAVPPADVLSINNPEQLAEVDAILRARLASEPDAAATGGGR